MPRDLESRIVDALRESVPHVQGIIALDQVQEHNCGVITDRVREELARLGRSCPERIFFADSRTRIGEFRDVIVKCNREEAVREALPDPTGPVDRRHLETCARAFSKRTGRPVCITLGPEGICCAEGEALHYIPGIPVSDPIDIVGAGDGVSAGFVSALCAGAGWAEAALLGVLVSSITIQQLGATGTASPDQVLQRFAQTFPHGWSAPAHATGG